MAEGKRRSRTGHVNSTGSVVWTKNAIEKIGVTLDGWQNILTGLGLSSRDKRAGASFAGGPRVTSSRELLSELYHGDDLFGRVVDLPAQEMYREWIDIKAGTGDSVDPDLGAEVLQALDTLDAQRTYTDAEVWASLYGGSIILLGIDDGQEPDEPLDATKIKSIDWMTALDRFDVEINSTYDDPMEEKFGLPQTYRLMSSNASRGEHAEHGTVIHESRTIRFEGARTSRHRRMENNGWADSVFERYYEVIKDFQGASGSIMHLLQDFSQATFKIKGLAKALAADRDGLVLKRLQMLDNSRSMVRAVPLDADAESFERTGAGVQGMPDLYDRMMMRVSAATGIPVTLLVGRSPAGMNATGESDIRLFYDHIAAMQETKVRPRLEYLIQLILSSKDGPTRGVEPESWTFDFNPLYQESAKEQAETRLAVAKADEVYIRNDVLSANEVAYSRFGGDTYSPDTSLDEEERAQRAAVEEAFEATEPVVVADAKEDAPNYRLQDEDAMRQVCTTCQYGRTGPVCARWQFVTDAGHVCDDWRPQELVALGDSRRADGITKPSGSRRRGRNY